MIAVWIGLGVLAWAAATGVVGRVLGRVIRRRDQQVPKNGGRP